MTEILLFTFIYMAFAVAAVLVSQKLGLGSVLGYLAAGIFNRTCIGTCGERGTIHTARCRIRCGNDAVFGRFGIGTPDAVAFAA